MKLLGSLIVGGITVVAIIFYFAVFTGVARKDPYFWIHIENHSNQSAQIATSYFEQNRWTDWDKVDVIAAGERKRMSVFYSQDGAGAKYMIGVDSEGEDRFVSTVLARRDELSTKTLLLVCSSENGTWNIKKMFEMPTSSSK